MFSGKNAIFYIAPGGSDLVASTAYWSFDGEAVDVAREGDDKSIIFPRQGIVAFEPVVMRNFDSRHREYREDMRGSLERYTSKNTQLVRQYDRLLEDLIEGRQEAEVTATVLFDPKGERARA